MSGHGKREAALLVDAVAWRDRTVADVESVEGRAAARAYLDRRESVAKETHAP
jgi:hypothetical protein